MKNLPSVVHCIGGVGVVGSNPATPAKEINHLRIIVVKR